MSESQDEQTPENNTASNGREIVVADPLYAGRYESTFSLLRAVAAVLRRRRLIAALAVGFVVLTVIFVLVQPPVYTSSGTFIPQTQQADVSQLAGVAAQFGVDIPAGQGGRSPEFYSSLLTSRDIVRDLVTTRYSTSDAETASGSARELVDIFDVDGDTREERVHEAIKELRERLSSRTEPETGIVRFAITTESAVLSHQIAEKLLDLVHRFNIQTRQSQAVAKRDFLADRSREARQELMAAEDSLETFLEQNRQYENSPRLRLEYERLQRRVSLRQQVYTSLAQSFEQAKIDAVRNMPVITVVERPELPALADSRSLILKAVLALFIGAGLGAAWALMAEVFAVSRDDAPDEYDDLQQTVRAARDDVRGAWASIKRFIPGPWK